MATTKVVTGEVRASYVNVFAPRLNDLSGQEEYSMAIIIPKTDKKALSAISGAIEAAKKNKWPKTAPANCRSPLRDGDTEKDDPEYKGHYWINLKSKTKPGIIDARKFPVTDEMSFISGDYCRVSMNAYSYSQKGNNGVSFGLNNIQTLRKGEPMTGRTRAEDDFGEVEVESGIPF